MLMKDIIMNDHYHSMNSIKQLKINQKFVHFFSFITFPCMYVDAFIFVFDSQRVNPVDLNA